MKRDLIVEVICQALGDIFFEETRVNSIAIHSPTENSQMLTITDHDGDTFSIEIKTIKNS
jgi:hypothetical protein